MTPNSGKSEQHRRLAARQKEDKDKDDNKLEEYCRRLGPFAWLDRRCRERGNNKPDEPQNPPVNAPPATTTPRPPAETPKTTATPPPPTSTRPPAAPAPTPTTAAPRPPPATTNAPSNPTTINTRPATDGSPTPQPQPNQPAPASSISQPAPSDATSAPVALPASTALSAGETDSRSGSVVLVPGTPTASTFTSLFETVSRGNDGVEHTTTIASIGVTTVTPLVPAPTDLDGGYAAPGSVGASSKSTNIGAIIGGILGALALLVLCAFGFLLYQKRKRGRIAPSSEFMRRYANTALTTPIASGSNVNVSQVGQAPVYTQSSYHHVSYPGEKS